MFANGEIYDPATASFHVTSGSMSIGRLGSTAVQLDNGGYWSSARHNGFVFTTTTELFDPATEQFSLTGSLHNARGGALVKLNDGRVLTFGGGTTAAEATPIRAPGSGRSRGRRPRRAARWRRSS